MLPKLQNKAKEPESIKEAYERCLFNIKFFEQLLNRWLTESSSLPPEGVACLKSALLQTICLIGDSLTWFRSGNYGRDSPEMPNEVAQLAANFNDGVLRKLIDFRNFYNHDFLYLTDDEKTKKFNDLFEDELLKGLSSIKEIIVKQLETVLKDKDYMLKSLIRNQSNPQAVFLCWSVIVRELAVLKKIFTKKEELEKQLGDQVVERAINGLVKNICQVYKDYTETVYRGIDDLSKPVCQYLDTLLKNPEMQKAFSVFEEYEVLRNYLAHPNMKSQLNQFQESQMDFLKNINSLIAYSGNIYDFLIKKLYKYQGVSAEQLMNYSGFYLKKNQEKESSKGKKEKEKEREKGKGIEKVKEKEKGREKETEKPGLAGILANYDSDSEGEEKAEIKDEQKGDDPEGHKRRKIENN